MIVALDGPAGAGKSTVAIRVAAELGYRLISTGALYRAVALTAIERGVSLDAAATLEEIAAGLRVEFEVEEGVNRVRLDGVDVTDALRSAEVSSGASVVSAIPAVRDALTELQRSYGRSMDVVMEGRDIGTVIFPGAETKVFLTASAEERARRRVADYERAGSPRPFEAVLKEIEERDERDTNRAVAPLRPAADAHHVDATDASVDEVVEEVVRLARAAAGAS